MGYQIPDNDQERLELINESLFKLICSDDYFDDEKWVMIRLNLDKWDRRGYILKIENMMETKVIDQKESLIFWPLYQ